jgi:hypothetical protein
VSPGGCGKLQGWEKSPMTYEFRIARAERALRHLEQDIPLLNMRVRDLSKERQESARRFAVTMVEHARAELKRLLEQRPIDVHDAAERPLEPAD